MTTEKQEKYQQVITRLRAALDGERDPIAVLATVTGELFHSFSHFDWVGVYRVTEPGILKLGPYQGGHGCLTIPFERGICGRCAREKRTQLVPDVTMAPDHIACSTTTRSEIVVPILTAGGSVRAVLDIDSDTPSVFDDVDREQLEALAAWLSVLLEGTMDPLPTARLHS